MCNNLDLITVTVPVYNIEKYLDKCIKSIINQTYTNIELILVNDGSTDGSLAICNKYKDDNRVIIINKINEGLSSARQAGIDKANGNYICFIDSDDYIENNFIEKLYNKINYDGSDTCVCSTRFYSEHNSRIYGFSSENVHQITKEDIENNYYFLLYKYYMSDSWNKMYRIEFIRNANVKFSLKKEFNGTDLSFNNRLMLHMPKISIVNVPLYNHQILGNSRVRRENKQLQKGFMIIMTQIIDEVNKLNYSNEINKQLNSLYAKFLREAVQDIYNSNISFKSLKEELIHFSLNNNKYLDNNNTINTNDVLSKSLKIFCFCMNWDSILIIYLKLRRLKTIFRKYFEVIF